jgi:hypothetical protein
MTIQILRWEQLYGDANHTRAVGFEYRPLSGRNYFRLVWGPVKGDWQRGRIAGGFMLRPAQVWLRRLAANADCFRASVSCSHPACCE